MWSVEHHKCLFFSSDTSDVFYLQAPSLTWTQRSRSEMRDHHVLLLTYCTCLIIVTLRLSFEKLLQFFTYPCFSLQGFSSFLCPAFLSFCSIFSLLYAHSPLPSLRCCTVLRRSEAGEGVKWVWSESASLNLSFSLSLPRECSDGNGPPAHVRYLLCTLSKQQSACMVPQLTLQGGTPAL